MRTAKHPNHLNGHGHIVKEFTAISTEDEFVLCVQFSDGSIAKSYERRAISDNSMEVIQHLNRDISGSYYTSRNVYLFSEGAAVNPDHLQKTHEEYAHEHLTSLCQSAIQNIQLSKKKTASFQQNLLSTMKHWLEVQAPNQDMQEYKTLSEIVAEFECELITKKEETTMKQPPTQTPVPQREALPMQMDVKIHSLHTDGPVLANASVTLNGCFAIRSIKVMNGSNGPFVSMPSYRSGDGYKDICFPCTKDFHQEFNDRVVAAYQQALEQLPQRQQEQGGQYQEAPPAPEMKM